MKKLEKLDLNLFKSLEENKIPGLSSILGGTFTTWTGNGTTSADMKVHSGNIDKPDATGECDDLYDTKVKVDCIVVAETDAAKDSVAADIADVADAEAAM
jgi:hypothetical protein